MVDGLRISESALGRMTSQQLNSRLADISTATLGTQRSKAQGDEQADIVRILKQREVYVR